MTFFNEEAVDRAHSCTGVASPLITHKTVEGKRPQLSQGSSHVM